MYQFVLLTSATAKDYKNLTYPTFRNRLNQLDNYESFIAVGASKNGVPIGLVLGELNKDDGLGEILSIFVIPEKRQKGIGTNLLKLIDNEFKRHNFNRLHLVYIPNTCTPALEKILQKLGWNDPTPRMLIYLGLIANLQHESWLSFQDKLSSDYKIFLWTELTTQEREDILRRQHDIPWYSEVLSPFKDETILEPLNSFGLQYQNQVIGWMITHRIAPDTIRYTALHIKQQYKGIGRAISLLANAINLQLQYPEITQASFAVTFDNKPMLKFVEKRMIPHNFTSLRQSMESFKII